jgi:hypothetical protein
MTERVIRALAGGDLLVEREQAGVGLVGVVGDRAGPAVGGADSLVELAVQGGEIGVGAVVQLVVELGQADLTLETDLLAAGDDLAGELGDLLTLGI